jgi:hypothetical protein
MTRSDDANTQPGLRRRGPWPKRCAENKRAAAGKKCAAFVVNHIVPEHRNLLAFLTSQVRGFFGSIPPSDTCMLTISYFASSGFSMTHPP